MREILLHLHDLVAEKEPLRFGNFNVSAAARPIQAAPSNAKAFPARGVVLEYIDGAKHMEVEQLEEIRHPKSRFSQAVRHAVFIYGDSYQERDAAHEADVQDPSVPVPGLPTDITFPALGPQVFAEVRRSSMGAIAFQCWDTHHLMLLHRGIPNAAVLECLKKLQCSTCERLNRPQQPRPATVMPSTASQFNESVQGDFFYVRLSAGEAVQVLGLADTATGFRQGAVLRMKC